MSELFAACLELFFVMSLYFVELSLLGRLLQMERNGEFQLISYVDCFFWVADCLVAQYTRI